MTTPTTAIETLGNLSDMALTYEGHPYQQSNDKPGRSNVDILQAFYPVEQIAHL